MQYLHTPSKLSRKSAEMAVKSLFLLGVVLAIVLLVCQDPAHARELTTANDVKGNVEPATGPDGLKEKKLIIGVGVFRGPGFGAGFQPQPGFGGGLQPQPGFGGGFQPGFGGGFGGSGNGFGGGFGGAGNDFGGSFGGAGNGFGGFGQPGRLPGGFNGFQPGFGGGFGVPGF